MEDKEQPPNPVIKRNYNPFTNYECPLYETIKKSPKTSVARFISSFAAYKQL
nr:hypothetical protein [Mucilaginibacter sp. X5P1]